MEDFLWGLRCTYSFWLHGPYGLSKVIERMPFRYIIKYLKKYGASIGENCRFERGLNLHRPTTLPPFKNLVIGNDVYLGHNTLIDLSEKVTFESGVIIASGCQFWTHASYYKKSDEDDALIYGETRGPIVVRSYSLVYSQVTVTNGVVINKSAKVGAKSLVIKDVNEGIFVAGIPSREVVAERLKNE